MPWRSVPHDLLLMTYSACCLTGPRTISPGVKPPTMGWPHPDSLSSLIKNMLYRCVYSLIIQRHFLNWGFLFSDNSSLCQVDIKPVSTGFLSLFCHGFPEHELYVEFYRVWENHCLFSLGYYCYGEIPWPTGISGVLPLADGHFREPHLTQEATVEACTQPLTACLQAQPSGDWKNRTVNPAPECYKLRSPQALAFPSTDPHTDTQLWMTKTYK